MFTRILVLLGLTFLFPFSGIGQDHLAPLRGDNGIPGTIPGSYIIKWAAVPGAVAYEYVLTNNELCFANCPGDTRQSLVTATEAVEFDLQDSTFYFWITRVVFGTGDTSDWTLPSYFLATAPDLSRPLAVSVPKEDRSQSLEIRLDWSSLAEAERVDLEVFTLNGKRIYRHPTSLRRQGVSQRFARYSLPFAPASPGFYAIRARVALQGGGEQEEFVKFAWW